MTAAPFSDDTADSRLAMRITPFDADVSTTSALRLVRHTAGRVRTLEALQATVLSNGVIAPDNARAFILRRRCAGILNKTLDISRESCYLIVSSHIRQ